ncbi:hypothetical protein HNQ93_002291 [Hymenobacter luteus]|uniref:Outer membrane protein beta-barrel domain-containing protein n=2 Tax=Hymenobacter TaxID=89966 RepID=A0A7W9T0P6_9BACT|nr:MULTISPECIES: hypothetical protein [Hymenobacter]MBB4602140.1 hypothetical protein [Hymenobacter latericoloratus]MBB6059431.1 hypothetical protein [Hymenobacter luteus]
MITHVLKLAGAGLAGMLLLAPEARAQRVLLRADPSADSVRARYGPNRAVYRHLYLGYAPVVGRPEGAGADLRYFKSAEFFVGLRHKFRLSQSVATGVDVRYARLAYHLQQNSRKLLPTPALHHAESVVLSQLQLEPYLRLNFGRRGNVIGHYLDVSGWGGWALGTSHHYEDRPGTGGGKRTVVVERNLSYLHRWPVGVGARLGSGRYAATARYRLSRTFTAQANPAYAELPRWVVGLELGLF